MSEINGPNFSVNNNLNFQNKQKTNSEDTPERSEAEEPKFKDFSDPKAEALGRSMLVKDVDNINSDLKALVKNPQIAENSDKMFETAYNEALKTGIENPYEEAATFSTCNMN